MVHPFGGLLAAGSARTNTLSADLATPAAFPHSRDRGGRSAGTGESNHFSACPGAARKSLILQGICDRQAHSLTWRAATTNPFRTE